MFFKSIVECSFGERRVFEMKLRKLLTPSFPGAPGKEQGGKEDCRYLVGCCFKSCWISCNARIAYDVVSTPLSSNHFFSPAHEPSGFCRLASLSVSSTRQSCFTPLPSV